MRFFAGFDVWDTLVLDLLIFCKLTPRFLIIAGTKREDYANMKYHLVGCRFLEVTDGILFLVFPKVVVRRLWDRSGWSPGQQIFTVAGKLCALVCLALLT